MYTKRDLKGRETEREIEREIEKEKERCWRMYVCMGALFCRFKKRACVIRICSHCERVSWERVLMIDRNMFGWQRHLWHVCDCSCCLQQNVFWC